MTLRSNSLGVVAPIAVGSASGSTMDKPKRHASDTRPRPSSLESYMKLMHVDKAAGTSVFYYPCLFGAFLAVSLHDNPPSVTEFLQINTQLLFRSFLIHGVGSSWNEIIDRDLDALVQRSKDRPIPSGAIPVRHAVCFTLFQFAILYPSIYWMFGWHGLFLELALTIVGLYYPMAKRHIYYPQVVLGICSGWGVFVSFNAFDRPLGLQSPSVDVSAAALLFLACVAWANIFDTLHSAIDSRDDEKLGLKSPMIRHANHRRQFFQVVALILCTAMAGLGVVLGAQLPYMLACYVTVGAVIALVQGVNLDDEEALEWWFAIGNPTWIAFAIALPLLCQYIL